MTGPRPGRGAAAVAVVALAAVTGLSTAPVWVRAAGVGVLTGTVPVAVRGAAAAPALPAVALVVAAAGVAIALAGRVGRWLVVVALAGAGVTMAWSVAGVLADPAPAARAAAAEATGVDRLVGEVAVTAWPWVALVLAVAVLGAAVGLALLARGWTGPSRRHEARRRPATGPDVVDAHTDWDALTRGDDPT